MTIAENFSLVKDEVGRALARRASSIAGTGSDVKLVAVTKNQELAAVREVIDAGALYIGENRVQEAISKAEILERSPEWHLIGHLQTNKARQAVALFDIIQSVDSERLAREINAAAAHAGKRQDVLIQVNVADEDSKFGISPEELPGMARLVAGLEHTRLCGLMTIAPFFAEPEATRPVFRETYRLFMEMQALGLTNVNIEWLSMGMTNDYGVAIEEGANLVRIGTAIFGPRHY
jgi:PLP dependent protein